jgi:hypothetical protein
MQSQLVKNIPVWNEIHLHFVSRKLFETKCNLRWFKITLFVTK